MKRSIGLWQFFGFGVTAFGGTVLHFLYEWLGEAAWIAPFSGVNESTWEHMKLFFFPAFFFAIFQSFFFKEYNNYWLIKLLGTMLGLMLIPIIFYTYNGAIGKSPDWLNILIFFISAGACFLFEGLLFKRNLANISSLKTPSIIIFILLCFAFFFFTFKTPSLGVFLDPIYKTYGIIAP